MNQWTGEVRLQRITSVMDIGTVVNLKAARSQIIGGVVFGIGMALLEGSVLEEKNGRYANANFADYLIATNADVPYVDVHFINKPDTIFNPLGARGIGEIGITGMPAAIANAVYNATGKRVREFPILPERILPLNCSNQGSACDDFVPMAWKELKQIITEYQGSDGPFALATLVSLRDRPTANLVPGCLLLQEGRFIGRLSAGCIEEEIADLGQAVILNGKPARCSFDLRSRFACDGSIEVFIERLVKPNAFLEGLAGVLGNRTPITVSTNYRLDDASCGDPANRIASSANHREEFVQQIQPPIRLIIFGDFFDAEAVAHLGGYLGWQVEVVTDADELSAGDARTACVVMSHHFGRDIAALKHVFAGNYGYVGLLGPRRRKQLLMSHLIDEGYLPKSVSTLHTPAGLDIGSETAEEIAVAIIAEIQAALTGRTGRSLRERAAPIHILEEPAFCDALR